MITSLSRNGAESTSSSRPDVRSSATRRIVSTAASTGSAGAAESAHSTATGVSPPSPARSDFAKSPPDTPRNTITATAIESDPASAPNVRVEALSQGLRKRVALADAILLRPRFLLLDDLLAGLDAETRISVSRIIQSVSSFAAIIVSGHELDEMQGFATKFLVLKDGHLIGAKTAAGVRTVLTAVPSKKGGEAAG